MSNAATLGGGPDNAKATATLKEQTSLPTDPVVSILCVTFNHAQFIRSALAGFLNQEVTFAVEVLIHDDASTDGTQQIVADFAAQYPNLVRATLQTENKYSMGVNVARLLREQAKGRFIAYCEGDDYWTDPTKLAQQVAYLDAHPEMVMCGHRAKVLNVVSGKFAKKKRRAREERSLTALDLRAVRYVPRTCTRMVRRKPVDDPPEMKQCLTKDAFYQSLLGQSGGYGFLKNISPSVYRVHGGGLWSELSLTKQGENQRALFDALISYYERIKDERTVKALVRNRRHALRHLKTHQLRKAVSGLVFWR